MASSNSIAPIAIAPVGPVPSLPGTQGPAVYTKHADYVKLIDQWERCRDAVAGSDAVKHKQERYLPMLDSHKKQGGAEKYKDYLLRALYYNASGRTVQGLAGTIFQKAPTVECPPNIADHIDDITLTDEPLEQFALTMLKEHLTTGKYGILIDMASEEAVDARPYWVGYRAEDIVNWRYTSQGGDRELTMVVLSEIIQEDDPKDEFKVVPRQSYRVLRLEDGRSKGRMTWRAERSSCPRSA
jgi:hypothetical protein